MKKYVSWLIGIPLSVVLLLALPGQKAMAQDETVSYQTFYDDLSPYGQWVNDNQYGNVWVPNAGNDFQPYGTDGHWAMTEYGNTWVSDYAWGWAPFHYGRWTYDPYYGWVWVPGYEWGPAWVDWRMGGGYCGWAPLSPGFSVSVGFGGYSCPDNWWVFMNPGYMYDPGCYRYRRGPSYNTTIIRQTTIINNTYIDNHSRTTYVIGPRAAQVQAVTHRPVTQYRLANAGRPGSAQIQGHSLNMYRPTVNRATINTARPANVLRAPQSIGRPSAVAANRQPAFHSVMQRQSPGMRPVTGTPSTHTMMQGNRSVAQPVRQNNNFQNRTPQNVQQNMNHPQNTFRNNVPQQNMNRPQQMNNNFNRAPQQQMNRPQQMNNNFNRAPQPQMNRPQQMNNNFNRAPQPQMNRPQQMNNNFQNRAPQQMSRPMEAPHEAPAAPHMEAPHMEGGGGERGGGERR